MTQGKQILVVDDHFAVLDALRTLLLGADPSYQVTTVPSAEEGFLALGRTPFDLLITDNRLPGMSGFELARRVRRLRPEIPIMIITASPSAPEREEAERLGVLRYLEKPLNTPSFLAAVHNALHGEERGTTAVAPREVTTAAGMRADALVETRLQILRADTGASQVALVAKDGHIVCQLGDEEGQEIAQLATIAAASMRNGLELAIQLESEGPVMIQYQAGERADLYTANVGADFFVMLLFDARERRGRIGTIWVFAQRAIRELKEMLPDVPAADKAPALTRQVAARHRPLPAPLQRRREPVPVTAQLAAPNRTNGTQSAPPTAAMRAADSQLVQLLDGKNGGPPDEIDAFWEEALEGDMGGFGSGLSFDEALAQGLLPSSFRIEAD
jgi:CheY-like chemotaxis protein